MNHKCQRCGSQFQGQICPFCTITGLDVNALLAAEGLTTPTVEPPASAVSLVDVVSNRVFPVTTPVCRFGRDISNDIVLSGDKSLSRFHFQITFMDEEYFIEDAGSRNGTFLNGSPVSAPRKILNGDIVSAGMSRYRFVLDGSELSAEKSDVDEVTEVLTGDDTPALTVPPGSISEASTASSTSPPATTSAVPPPSAPSAGDPLTKIFQEGKALLSSQEEEDDADLPGFFSPGADNGKIQTEELNKFIQLNHPTEPTIDELFDQKFPGALDKVAASQGAATGTAATAGNAIAPARLNQTSASSLPVSNSSETMPCAATAPDHIAESTGKAWPAWCKEYSLPELSCLQEEISKLETRIKQDQDSLQQLKSRFSEAEDLKNRLLASRGDELLKACTRVFEGLGFLVQPNAAETQELVLSTDGKTSALARIVSTDSEPAPADMAHLVSSLSNYWCEHGIEPKGIMIVSIMHDGPPSEHPEFTREYCDYAAKKNFCLMSALQLLSIYGEIVLGGANADSIRSDILNASGQLPEFRLTHN